MSENALSTLPKWAESCPKAYGDYLAAHADLDLLLKNSRVSKDVRIRAGVCMARAWTAGQDSVSEKPEDE